MRTAPEGTARARFGLQLAKMRTESGNAAAALQALRASESPDLSPDLSEERGLAMARAQSKSGDLSGAVSTLFSIGTATADELRASLLEAAKDWRGALAALRDLAAKRIGAGSPLTDEQQEIAVREGQEVRPGQLLFRLDPAPFRHAVDAAKAQLDQTVLTLRAEQEDYRRMERDIAAQEAAVQLAEATYERAAQIVNSGAVTRAAYDQARFGRDQAQHQLESLRVQAQVQLARLGGAPDKPVEDLPQHRQAQAQLEEAQRQLDHTVVRAPFAGVVTQVPQLQPGQYLAAATPAFALVSTDHVWVDALPKETDLTHVKPGDPATVTVDTYPGREWRGTVESISPASGNTFSVLPAQNSSGNWVKVVQRIPIRIHVNTHPGDPPLRSGMSVEADVDTGHTRTLHDLF